MFVGVSLGSSVLELFVLSLFVWEGCLVATGLGSHALDVRGTADRKVEACSRCGEYFHGNALSGSAELQRVHAEQFAG